MASISGSHQHQNPTFQSAAVFNFLDPVSLILSQNSSDSFQPIPLKLTTESSYVMERGPRYTAYAQLRESKLRTKTSIATASSQFPEQEMEPWRQTTPPPKKQVKFKHQPHILPPPVSRRASGYGASMLAQSVPDFSAALRKENRKPRPAVEMVVGHNMTPPPCKRVEGVLSSRGSKSVGSGEKRRGIGMARKSYASMDELKGLSVAASNSIMNGENRVGRITSSNRGNGGRGIGKTVLGYRHHF